MMIKCPTCNGRGVSPQGRHKTCTRCKGMKEIAR